MVLFIFLLKLNLYKRLLNELFTLNENLYKIILNCFSHSNSNIVSIKGSIFVIKFKFKKILTCKMSSSNFQNYVLLQFFIVFICYYII